MVSNCYKHVAPLERGTLCTSSVESKGDRLENESNLIALVHLQVYSELSACRPLKSYLNQRPIPNLRPQSGKLTLKINFKFEPPTLRQHRLPKISEPANARRHVVYPEVLDAKSLLQLFPFDWS